MLTAPILAVTTSISTGAVSFTVRCPVCRQRHRHRWPEYEDTPGSRESHCQGRKRHRYLIGPVPPAHLVQALADLRRAGNRLARMAWTEQYRTDDVDHIGECATTFVAAVERAQRRGQ